MMALSMFGAMFTWLMIFVTHWFSRRRMVRDGKELSFKVPLSRIGSLLGAGLMIAIMFSTLATEAFNMTLVFGVPFTLIVTALYFVVRRRKAQGTAPIPDPEPEQMSAATPV